MTDRTEADLITNIANRAATEWMDEIIEAQKRALREVERMRDRLIRAIEEDDRPEDVIGWTVNEVQNNHRQPRLDMAPKIAADLAVARHMRKAEMG